jgi:hypothetical protein
VNGEGVKRRKSHYNELMSDSQKKDTNKNNNKNKKNKKKEI